jgi:predicted dinucleotide-binding enzyme
VNNTRSLSIIGSGKVGRTLAQRFAAQGYSVFVGSRRPSDVASLPELTSPQIIVTSIDEAISSTQICLLAIPWKECISFVQRYSPWRNKILIDCSNPLNSSFNGLELGYTTSAAEEIAKAATEARVIKALNTASVETMRNPIFNGTSATMFYCGNDTEAKQIVHELLSALSFQPIDCGPLDQSRNLEPLAMLYIHLAVRCGFGPQCAFSIMKRN